MVSTPTLVGRPRRSISIGPYEVVGKPLGKGGMGTVYPVQDDRGRRWAVKEFSPLLVSDRQLKARFRQEHRILERLGHPNVVKVTELFEANGTLNMCMELLEGRNLREILKKKKILDPGIGYAIGSKVASALAHAHGRGVLHRDVKPENIVITMAGRVKLTDFSVAKLGSGGLTAAGSVVGTPDYLPPEQLTGARDLTVTADLFSLGMLLYEVLEGRLPYPRAGKTGLLDLAKRRAEKPPRFPARIPDQDVATIILRCLDPDPSRRPREARDLVRTLSQREDAMAEKKLADLVCEITNRRRPDRDEPALIAIPTPRLRRVTETLLGFLVLAAGAGLAMEWLLGRGGTRELVQWSWGLLQAIGWGLVGGP